MDGISLAANIIAVVDLTTKVIERLNDFRNSINGIPRMLQAISNELPALNLVLSKIQKAIDDGRIAEDSRDALNPLMLDFKEHIQAILDIIEKIRPKDNSRMARNLKAVGSFRYDGQIQYHESVIRKYAQTLSLERIVSGPEKDVAGMYIEANQHHRRQTLIFPSFTTPFSTNFCVSTQARSRLHRTAITCRPISPKTTSIETCTCWRSRHGVYASNIPTVLDTY
jgi:hypothetical protein